ncbi:hypothetical protein [Alicyclobacillus shizuokensis]|uniref:hypothetical protein n=1 Tax=Alicyclobacillus shizuokensis TaxID=392014 RepID=UPI00082C497D|nr:hypothetical protein [Alicyclobacillus shizuokensis]
MPGVLNKITGIATRPKAYLQDTYRDVVRGLQSKQLPFYYGTLNNEARVKALSGNYTFRMRDLDSGRVSVLAGTALGAGYLGYRIVRPNGQSDVYI